MKASATSVEVVEVVGKSDGHFERIERREFVHESQESSAVE
jgi:hypothetical protein